MPSIAQATLSPLSKVKRKRDLATSTEEMPMTAFLQPDLAHPTDNSALPPPSTLYFIPHPQQLSGTAPFSTPELCDEVEFLAKRQVHAMPRRRDSKRQRISIESTVLLRHALSANDARISKDQPSHAATEGTEEVRETKPKRDLSPCYICHRKPTIKAELHQYADCEGCGRRTCYICMRECLGTTVGPSVSEAGCYNNELDHDMLFSLRSGSTWFDDRARNIRERSDSGYDGGDEGTQLTVGKEKTKMTNHKSKVCSRCCVERGMTGEVLCLGCLRVESEA